VFRKKEKIRAARARQEFVESYQNIVKMEQQEENEEVKKIKGLIAQDEARRRF
jgi:predicted GNAT family acetyltransferase